MDVLRASHRGRLDQELILWLTTVRPNGQPQTLPVWFVIDGSDLLVWSQEGARTKNLAGNSLVSAHVNDNGTGGNILSIEGAAVIEPALGLASQHPEYVKRYQRRMDKSRWSWDWFDSVYNVPIRISPRKVRTG
ncbi:MAG TPA: pyridoxamine 5'-phosphate oxidase family protein [Acidimicrobiia bacterium]|jgi:PPOX class probable F420-dependent enzyme